MWQDSKVNKNKYLKPDFPQIAKLAFLQVYWVCLERGTARITMIFVVIKRVSFVP